MTAAWILIGIVLLAAAWNVLTSLLLYDALRKRGRNPSFVLLRLYAPSYAFDYRKLTVAETGRPGPLFFHWFASIYTALLAAVILLVV